MPHIFSDLKDAMNIAGASVLGETAKKSPEWFEKDAGNIHKLIDRRNIARKKFDAAPQTELNKKQYKQARKEVVKYVRRAKKEWHNDVVRRINNILEGANGGDQKYAWKGITVLSEMFGQPKKMGALKIDDETGEPCTSAKQTADVVQGYYEPIFTTGGKFDPTVIDQMQQKDVIKEMDKKPLEEEIEFIIMKMENDKSPGDNGIPIEFYKTIMRNKKGDMREILIKIIQHFWENSNCINEDWLVAVLKLVPKKGNNRLLKNWRPVMLLDVCSKIVSGIIGQRLIRLLVDRGMEIQNGFMFGRGTPDGIASLLTAIRKRAEGGRQTYALFVDLIKAFDTVSRECMFLVLAKYGVPEKLITIIKALYTGTTVKFEAKGEVRKFGSTVGVKQGDPLASTLFLFVMQAAMETLTEDENWPKQLKFLTRKDGVMHQRQIPNDIYNGNMTNFFEIAELWASLYADDGAFLFDNRKDLEKGTTLLYSHFERFGMSMHVGTNGAPSKTEAMYFPKMAGAGHPGSKGTITIKDADGKVVGTVEFTESFKYLGKIISSDLSEHADVTKRINLATVAYTRLKDCFFKVKKGISNELKGRIYNSLILSILLSGSEHWRMDAEKLKQLNKFHNAKVKEMTGMRWQQMRAQSISIKHLLPRLGLLSIESYITTKALGWLGHVARMPWNRDPRRLLTSIAYLPPSKHPNLLPANSAHSYGQSIHNHHFKRILKHPDIDKYPDIIANLSFKPSTQPSGPMKTLLKQHGDDFIYSWYHLATNRQQWLTVLTLAEHEHSGKEFLMRLKKKQSKIIEKNGIMKKRCSIEQHYYPVWDQEVDNMD